MFQDKRRSLRLLDLEEMKRTWHDSCLPRLSCIWDICGGVKRTESLLANKTVRTHSSYFHYPACQEIWQPLGQTGPHGAQVIVGAGVHSDHIIPGAKMTINYIHDDHIMIINYILSSSGRYCSSVKVGRNKNKHCPVYLNFVFYVAFTFNSC